ncbi:MAG: hypothetical protein GY789_26500 [Hyphomicrobiales bacterium]|nr:hypothetical protein [Hyphomicrobiales bacterium]MCP5000470.1 hypothetical protein [Hyphomicrobiales bacterium]
MGFHQSYDGATKRAQGNAVVGYYLGELNFSYNPILFATEASPNRLKYLTAKNAKQAEIQYETKVIDIFDLPLRRVPIPKNRLHTDTANFAGGKS